MTRSAISRSARMGGRNGVVDGRTMSSSSDAVTVPEGGRPGGDQLAGDEAGLGSVTVYVQLRPRVGVARRCLAVLAELAEQHAGVAFDLVGVNRDDRVVRFTLGVDLGPRAEIAKFGPDAQAAYAFVNALFVSLYDHMPVYAAEPSAVDRAAAAAVLAAGEIVALCDVADPATVSVPAPRRGVPVHAAADSVRETSRRELTAVPAGVPAVA